MSLISSSAGYIWPRYDLLSDLRVQACSIFFLPVFGYWEDPTWFYIATLRDCTITKLVLSCSCNGERSQSKSWWQDKQLWVLLKEHIYLAIQFCKHYFVPVLVATQSKTAWCHYRDGTQFINTPYSLFQICTYRLRYLSAKAYRILRDSIKFKDKKVVIFYFQYAPYVPIILPVIFMIKQQRVVLILQYRNGTHFNQSFPLSNNLASIVRDSHYHNPNFPFILHIHFKIDFLYFICFSQKNVSFKI